MSNKTLSFAVVLATSAVLMTPLISYANSVQSLSLKTSPDTINFLIAQRSGTPIRTGTVAVLTSEDASSPINVRESASADSFVRHVAYAGEQITILNATNLPNGDIWYEVEFVQSGSTGWIQGNFITVP